MSDENTTRLVKADAVAKACDISEAKVKELAEEGVIPSIRLGPKLLRFDLDEVIAALKEREAATDRSAS